MKYYNSTTEFNCGIDLHAHQMYVCLMDRSGKKLVHTNIRDNDFEFFLKLVAPYRHAPTPVECTPEERAEMMELLVLGQQDDRIFERQQHARIHVEGQVQVERAATSLLRVEVDLPHLPQRVRLHEVPLVVYMKAVVDGVVLQVRHVSGDVYGCHNPGSLGPKTHVACPMGTGTERLDR